MGLSGPRTSRAEAVEAWGPVAGQWPPHHQVRPKQGPDHLEESLIWQQRQQQQIELGFLMSCVSSSLLTPRAVRLL